MRASNAGKACIMATLIIIRFKEQKGLTGMIRVLWACVFMAGLLSCDSDFTTPDIVLVNLGVSPAASEDLNTSYHKSKTSLVPAINYATALTGYNAALLHDAVAYLDVDGDADVDIFFATGDGTTTPQAAELYINDAGFTNQAGTFLVDYSDPPVANIPTSLNARKALVSDFNETDGNNLDEIFVLDPGVSGASPKMILHHLDPDVTTTHYLRYQIYSQQVGSYTTGAAADIDNDGDTDIFIGGSEAFFYINNGFGSFQRVTNRWDNSMAQIDAAELIDIDEDGFVDLIVGADESAGYATSIYWGNSTGTYTSDLVTALPAAPAGYATYTLVLDFEAEDLDADNNKDIVVYRTTAADTDRVVQLIRNNGGRVFTDATVQIDNPVVNNTSRWLRAQDMGGTGAGIDIFPDNAAAAFWFDNDGTGNFIQN